MTELVAIDWGTSSFRLYILDSHGNITEKHVTDEGIMAVEGRQYGQVLKRNLEEMKIGGDLPIICSGMITSKNGWFETEYVPCPATAGDIAANLACFETTDFGRIHFVPGVKQLEPQPDIMRGEETQLLGLTSQARQVIILPGTHSKWVTVENETILEFTTFMTGDLYNALTSNTILQAVKRTEWSEEDFRAGVWEGAARIRCGNGLLAGLFQTRVKSILELDGRAASASYLSGFLIGTEIGEAGKTGFSTSDNLLIAGGDTLTRYYRTALAELGIKSKPAPADSAAYGLFRIARLKKLIG
ncbi:2-dehydro-3-deoxygalactonokinase [Desulfopila sp. IMCC35008]|uniref:2-dehydro-3-deoxygalactonokinase n=1 Tax=Desulfopila sp. IMCC35008 TaxID=2653858 RepID=UPI0013D27E59|nr:2-dehydro-3-deoxygalactonokinase [Desulfopila sp. IMCC35008]